MQDKAKRNLFLAVILILIAGVVVISAVTLSNGPRTGTVEVVNENAGDNKREIKDQYEGNITIPKFNVAARQYDSEKFVDKNGVITYEGGTSAVGINVNDSKGEIDWAAVKESGVDFAMIRVGYRGTDRGLLYDDKYFAENIKGASDAGLDVGVYFFSQAITTTEAEEEAGVLLEKIREYKIQYPVAFYWEYQTDADGNLDQTARTKDVTGEQLTDITEAFCKKVSKSGRTACYYATKTMGYEKLNLDKLADYDMWYAEYKPAPSFYYNFQMWQYTREGTVPGFAKGINVPITLALKKYGS